MQFELFSGGMRATARTRGGELISLQDGGGAEYIWSGDASFWSGRNPVLFPIVGSLKDGRVEIGGRLFEMSRHGFARNLEFTPVEQTESSVTLELRESEETLSRYPFPFSLRIRHRLLESGFSTAFTVENTGNAPMPFCIGAHTAIRCPLGEGERFEDYELAFDEQEQADTLLLTPAGLLRGGETEPMLPESGRLPLDYALFRRLDTIIFRGLRSAGVSLLHKGTGRGVRLDFHEFPMAAFWTAPGAPFLCLEPWHGCAALDSETGRFQDKPFSIELLPGRRKRLEYSFTLVEGRAGSAQTRPAPAGGE